MIQVTRKIYNTARGGFESSIGKNVLSLYSLQFANYILPFVTVPYLLRVLGPEKFGAVSFVQGLMGYFTIIVNYGFDFSATRKIAIERSDTEAVSRTTVSVWAAKALLGATSLLLLVALIQFVPRLTEVSSLSLILYGIVIGNMFFPTWLFQGMERMIPISAINLGVRILTTVCIFGFVHEPSDFMIYAELLSLQWLLAGLIGIWLAFTMLRIRLLLPSWQEVLSALVDGWTLFLSTGAISLYTVGNAFVLGMLTNNTIVGYYSAGEKLVRVVVGFIYPISQAVYPRISKLASNSRAQAIRWARRMVLLLGGIGLAMSTTLFLGASVITQVILGSDYVPTIAVIRILALLPLVIALSTVFGIQIMLPFGKDRAFTSILLFAGFLNLMLAIVFSLVWEASGMALAVLLSEVSVTVSMYVYLRHCHLEPFRQFTVDVGIAAP